MGISMSYFNLEKRNQRYFKSGWKLRKMQAANQLQSAEDAQKTDLEETERGRAFLGQSLAGRGLSKSSIADQDTERYGRLADRRKAAMQRRVDLAIQNKDYVNRAIKYEKKSRYAQLVDGFISIFGGIGQGGAGSAAPGGSMGGGGESFQGTGFSSQDYYGFTPGQG